MSTKKLIIALTLLLPSAAFASEDLACDVIQKYLDMLDMKESNYSMLPDGKVKSEVMREIKFERSKYRHLKVRKCMAND